MKLVTVGARASKLSIKQVEEIERAVAFHDPLLAFSLKVCSTKGDLDQKTSLRDLEKTDFFTYELDQWLLEKKCDIVIHSAKDLPEPLNSNLEILAITEPLNQEDVIVFHKDQDLSKLSENCVIATSSYNREINVLKAFPSAKIVDIRGDILQRLEKVEKKEIDGVVIAKVALVRLGLEHLNMLSLDGETTQGQGSLAILAKKGNLQLQEIFSKIDSRVGRKSLYFGINPKRYYTNGFVEHCPLIEIVPYPKESFPHILRSIQKATHLIITSQQTVKYLFNLIEELLFPKALLKDKKIIAVGQSTAMALQKRDLHVSYIAKDESAEGIVKIIDQIKWKDESHVFYPKSASSRSLIKDYLIQKGVSLEALNLYEPKALHLKQKPDLNKYDELVFTSPSCVKAFFENYLEIPSHLKVICIGPVTQKALDEIQLTRI